MKGVIYKSDEMTCAVIAALGYTQTAPMAERIRKTIGEFIIQESVCITVRDIAEETSLHSRMIDADTLKTYIYLNDGTVIWESLLPKLYPDVNMTRLLSCVSDNIIEDADGERIDYEQTAKDYEESDQ